MGGGPNRYPVNTYAVDFTFVEHGAGVALVAGLGTALAIAGPALSTVHVARAV